MQMSSPQELSDRLLRSRNQISRIDFTKSGPNESKIWTDTRIRVTWVGESSSDEYSLSPAGEPQSGIAPDEVYDLRDKLSPHLKEQVHHSTLANSYLAVNTERTHWFVLKLPDLDHVVPAQVKKRLALIRRALSLEVGYRESSTSAAQGVLPRRLGYSTVVPDNPSDAHLWCISSKQSYPYIAYEYLKGMSLRDWIHKKHHREKFNGLADVREWFALAKALVRSLDRLHRERVTHGFICPDTVIIPYDVLQKQSIEESDLLQFVNAAGSQQVVDLPIKNSLPHFTRIRRWYDAMENIYHFHEPRENSAEYIIDEGGSDYHSTTDIFSLGITLAFLATGRQDLLCPFEFPQTDTSLPIGWQTIAYKERRTVYASMKSQLLEALRVACIDRRPTDKQAGLSRTELENSLRQAEVILHCVRSRVERRARNVEHLATVIDLFQPDAIEREVSGRSSNLSDLGRGFKGFRKGEISLSEATLLAETLTGRQCDTSVNRVFADQLATVANNIRLLSEERGPTPLRISSGRPDLVDSFLAAMSSLDSDDTCIALTTPTLWNELNFGPTGRASSMLQIRRLRGAGLRWIILVKNSDLYKHEVQHILKCRGQDNSIISDTVARDENSQRRNQDGFFYVPMSDDEYEDSVRFKQSFIGVARGRAFRECANEDCRAEDIPMKMMIAPDFVSRGGELATLTYWSAPERPDLLENYVNQLRKCIPAQVFDRSA